MKPSALIGIVIGIAAVAGGMVLSAALHGNEFLKGLEEKGIPLDPGKTVAAIGVLLILFPVVKGFFITPLNDAIESRTTHLESTFTEAENLRNEMTKMKTDYEARLVATEASARTQIQEEIKKAQEMRQQLTAQATTQIEEMKARASADIATEKDRVINGLRVSTVNLTLAATEKILGESVDDARNRKLIEEFIEKAEVPV